VFFMEDLYDVLILGGGPAGLTAAIYCGRYNLKTVVVAQSFGGTANLAGEVENWPGFVGSGMELMGKVRKQAEGFGAEFVESGFSGVVKDGDEFVLTLDDERKIRGRSLIVCLGTEHRQLNIPGEKEFLGKGVSYCATCDGNFFRGKDVAVVGGADSAAKAALYLADICSKVYVVYRKHEMRCEPVSLEKLKRLGNVEIVYHAVPTEIVGEGVVKKLKYERSVFDGDSVKEVLDEEVDVSGVFVEVGSTPASDVLKKLDLEMDERGYVVSDKGMRTSVEGVFVAGDVRNTEMRQMITAAGDGATSAKGAHEFLME
jgi:thioredoxin reductase (NADPH)